MIWGIIGGVLLSLLASEIYSSCPWLTTALLKRAKRALPEEYQDRYWAEWMGELNSMGNLGNLQKLGWALSVFFFSRGFRSSFRRSFRRSFLAAKIYESCSWLTTTFLELAKRVLPEEYRDRYCEEWQAELDVQRDFGNLRKLRWALRVFLSSARTAATLRSAIQGNRGRDSHNLEKIVQLVNDKDLACIWEHIGESKSMVRKVLEFMRHNPVAQVKFLYLFYLMYREVSAAGQHRR